MEHGFKSGVPEHADFYLRGREVSIFATYRFKQGVSWSLVLRVASFELLSFESSTAAAAATAAAAEAAAAREGTSSTASVSSTTLSASSAGPSRGSPSCRWGSRRASSRQFLEEDVRSPQLFQAIVTVCH